MKEKKLPFVWKIGENNLLIGTMHVIPYSFDSSLHKILEGKKTVLTEAKEEKNTNNLLMRMFSFSDSSLTLRNILSNFDMTEEVERLENFRPYFNRMFPTRFRFDDLTPYGFYCVAGNSLVNRTDCFLDRQICDIAEGKGIQVLGLEKSVESYKRFIAQKETFTKMIAEEYLSQPFENLKPQISEMQEHYVSANKRYFKKRIKEIQEIEDDMERNKLFLERSLPYLEQGGAVVVVGLAHTPYLIKNFKKSGYKVKRIKKSL